MAVPLLYVGALTALAVALLHTQWPSAGKRELPQPPTSWHSQPPLMLLVLILLLDIIHNVLCKYKLGPISTRISEERSQAVTLRRDASRLSSPDTFVQAAKLQRRAITADRAAELLTSQREVVKKSWSINSPRTLKRLAMAGFVLWYWGEPVLGVNSRLLWPFGWWFASPHYMALYGIAAITAGPWVTLCQAASSLLCQLW